MNILTVNLVFSTLIFWIIAKLYLFPRLEHVDPRAILTPLLLLHATRHLGLMFLAPGAVYPGIPAGFAWPAAIGDFVASLLALLSILALRRRSTLAMAILWIFSIEGSVDLAAAIVLATMYDAHAYMGAAYWIPALWVPALLVSHVMIFRVLLRRGGEIATASGRPGTG